MAIVPSSGGENPPDQSQKMRNPKAYKPQLDGPLNSNPNASDLFFGDAITVARNRNKTTGIFQHDSCSDFAIRSHGVCFPHQELSLLHKSGDFIAGIMSSKYDDLSNFKAAMDE